jgi:hypothetical protein
MKTKLNVYGINSIEVNGLPLHTVLIRGNYTEENKEIFNKYNIPFSISNDVKPKMYIRYNSTDYEAFRLFVNRLGRALKEIAQLKLEQKYQWVLFN